MYAVTQPTYNNNNLQDFTAWLNDNLMLIATYAIQLGVTDDELYVFAQIQYDRAVMLDRMEFELALSHQLQQVAA
jgi:hypothetical protein